MSLGHPLSIMGQSFVDWFYQHMSHVANRLRSGCLHISIHMFTLANRVNLDVDNWLTIRLLKIIDIKEDYKM